MSQNPSYTTQLQAGLGMVDETKALLELWEPGMSVAQLHKAALSLGRFPTITSRRLRNVVAECFAPRYLTSNGSAARHLKQLMAGVSSSDLNQLMLIYTCRANPILGDFVRDVYWSRYEGGYSHLSSDDARGFVERSIDDGKTTSRWSESTVRRVSAYLLGTCADYGLLDRNARSRRSISPPQVSYTTSAYLAHDLHFAGLGDNAILMHPDWGIFGLAREDVVEELKRLALMGFLILQAAGDVIRISWKQPNMEALCDVLAQS